MNNWQRTGKVLSGAGLIAIGLILGLALASSQSAAGNEPQQTSRTRMVDRGDALPDMVPQGVFVDVADSVSQAVVFIESERPQPEQARGNNNERFQQFFDDFFGRGERPDVPKDEAPDQQFEDKLRSQGSGILVTADGYIVTNAHVVASFNPNTQQMDTASKVRVTLADDRLFEAEIVGADLGTDIAVLKVDAHRLPHAPLGDSDAVKVGEWVMAIGAPFGLQNTVSAGIVSALGRANLTGMVTNYQSFVQTDAAINPGNSGGPLVNLRGEVIGINTAIATSGGFNPSFNGVGFAVPANMARRVMKALIDHGRVIRGYLGVTVRELTRDMREAYDLDPRMRGAIVNEITPQGPADVAGLQSEDIVVGMNGERLHSQQDFLQRIATHAPGDVVDLDVIRGSDELDVKVTLTERPTEAQIIASQLGLNDQRRGQSGERAEREDSGSGVSRRLGLRVTELTDRIVEREEIPDNVSGVVVADVAPNSPAWNAGIRQGDVIMRINRAPIESVEGFERMLANVGPGGVVAAYIWSQGNRTALPIPLRVPHE